MGGPRSSPEELADQLRELSVALRRHARSESAGASGLPYPQLAVLKQLEADGPATTAELARKASITPQSMGTLVGSLESAGLVSRRDDPDHGRRQFVSVTATGRKTLASQRATRLHRTAQLLADRLDPDERRTVASAVLLLHRVFGP